MGGCSPCISGREYKDPIKILDMNEKVNTMPRAEQSRAEQSRAEQSRAAAHVRIIGQMDNKIDHTFESANRIYDISGLSPTLPTGCGGGHIPKVLIDDPH